jgi:hypothetical protein
MKYHFDTVTSDFTCKHCRGYVSTNPLLSGVHNRNHCPYCLWSRHMDLREAGDRLSACKAAMTPVGLTLKQTGKKYGSQQGELMIIHQCMDCGKVSINRIAADDDADNILSVFHHSLRLDRNTRALIGQFGIHPLDAKDEAVVHARLFGWARAGAPSRVVA